jgi:molecular chaperone HtpG
MLEAFKAKGYEVLLMSDGIDEFMMNSLLEFGDKKFHDIARGDVDFEKTEDEKKAEEENKGIFKGLCENLQKVLDEDIKEVRVSSRLKDSPCCLVTSEDAMSAQMERMMKAMGQKNLPKSKRILEINPTHPICEMLKKKVEAKEDLGDWPKALYGQALLAEGSPLPNPAEYVSAITKLLTASVK